jgi:hypothetical protein
MLLDVHAVKTILLDLPNLNSDKKAPVSAVCVLRTINIKLTFACRYVKFVTKGMLKAETLLKVVLTPLDPPEGLIKNFLILSGDGGEMDEKMTGSQQQKLVELRDGFVKILDLKVRDIFECTSYFNAVIRA